MLLSGIDWDDSPEHMLELQNMVKGKSHAHLSIEGHIETGNVEGYAKVIVELEIWWIVVLQKA